MSGIQRLKQFVQDMTRLADAHHGNEAAMLANGRLLLWVMLSRSWALSRVKMWTPFLPREIVTYHCSWLVAAWTEESEKITWSTVFPWAPYEVTA